MQRSSPLRGLVAAFVSIAALVVLAALPTIGRADTVVLKPKKDNTIYEEAGDLSNGAGNYLFVGRTRVGPARRALLAFDVAANVPAGATIDEVTLTLHLSRSDLAGTTTVSLHRLLADWGEGASDAVGEEGTGDLAEAGDATWTERFFAAMPAAPWATAGGDLAASASATTSVAATLGSYAWSSAAMVADVQGWLDQPDQSFGWTVVGDETTLPTAKRFDSRDNGVEANRPSLEIVFTPANTVCGNGIVEADEQCDDGDATWVRGQACNATCRRLACGDPDDSGGAPTASDALFTLQASVALQGCDECVCDVDDDGAVRAVDALRLLRRATGQPLALTCPACP